MSDNVILIVAMSTSYEKSFHCFNLADGAEYDIVW